MSESTNRPKPVVLISMDGVGVAAPGPGNAVTLANTPNLDKFWPTYPHGTLAAAGLYVGLPRSTDGNSEVGHAAMGAGKIVLQDLPRIDNAIKNGSFYENPLLLKAVEHSKTNNGKIHLVGLIGNGFVHSSLDHLYALLELMARQKVDPKDLYIHAITDGRDSAPDSGYSILEKVEAYCIQKKVGNIVSIIGRAYAMDRNKNWSRTKRAYDLMTLGTGRIEKDWRKAVNESYKNKVMDEYIEPVCIVEDDGVPKTVKSGDSVIFFNFRPDRAQQLTRAFEEENFIGWQRQIIPNMFFVGMTDYKKGFPHNQAFPPEQITLPLGKVISQAGLKQLRIAESEKFPHVTFFFNGGNAGASEGEDWIEVPSPKDVATYDLKPEMSQEWSADIMIEKINEGNYDFMLINFAGPDMVGHTGNIQATIKAMEVCDMSVGKIVDAVLKKDGAVLITADHGNAEEMINLQNGEADTKHSINPVPLIIIKKGLQPIELPVGNLGDVAPTILGLLGLQIPAEMTGKDLLSVYRK